MEDVLRMLASGSEATPFTFPAGLLGGAAAPALGPTNLDRLGGLLQNGAIPSFIMGSLGSGGPLPLPQALALPSLELPKLLSLDMGLDGGGPNPRAGAAAAAAGGGAPDKDQEDEGAGSRGNSPPPHLGRGGRGGLQLPPPLLPPQPPPQLPQPLLPFDGPATRQLLNPTVGGKRDLEELSPPGRSKRRAAAAAMDVGSEDQEEEEEEDGEGLAAAALLERPEPAPRRAPARRQQQASNSEGSGSDSEAGGRPAPARNGKRGGATKDPAARAAIRQLKKRDLNREAQRRFRDRQKAALALLESTTQSQQREIEALRLTNKLLEEQYRVLMDQYKGLQLRFVALQMKAQGKS